MKVVVLGANGQLGRDVAAAFAAHGSAVTGLAHDQVEIASPESVRSVLDAIRPDLVVNTAAFHHVEKCEADPARAFAVNAAGARNVAQATEALHAALIHISTDYVFDGLKGVPYHEDDQPMPLNVYGNTKLSGEYFVRSLNPRHYIVRVSAIYGENPCRAKGGLNFVELMIKLSGERPELHVVDDEFVTPTPTVQIAHQLVELSGSSLYGLYHATAEGACSWFEFAAAIFELTGCKVRLERARPGEFPAKVPRPKYSVLENRALKERFLNVFTDWRDGLSQYLANRQKLATLSST
jgi:dTDP-4-dehydrorhamnose reductase